MIRHNGLLYNRGSPFASYLRTEKKTDRERERERRGEGERGAIKVTSRTILKGPLEPSPSPSRTSVTARRKRGNPRRLFNHVLNSI
jgi:hypothetical protein